MSQKNIIPIILSTLAGALAALAVCAFFFFYYKPAQNGKKTPTVKQDRTLAPEQKPTETPRIETEKINLSDINSLSISTVYTGFYDAGSECGKSRMPAPKPEDTVALSYSPCRTELTFKRDGEAAKSLIVKRIKDGRETEEKTEWKSKITAEQFETLLKGVALGEDFIEWESVSIYHSNGTIYAYHTKGMVQIPFYIDVKKGSSREPMLDAFKELDKKVVWQKI